LPRDVAEDVDLPPFDVERAAARQDRGDAVDAGPIEVGEGVFQRRPLRLLGRRRTSFEDLELAAIVERVGQEDEAEVPFGREAGRVDDDLEAADSYLPSPAEGGRRDLGHGRQGPSSAAAAPRGSTAGELR